MQPSRNTRLGFMRPLSYMIDLSLIYLLVLDSKPSFPLLWNEGIVNTHSPICSNLWFPLLWNEDTLILSPSHPTWCRIAKLDILPVAHWTVLGCSYHRTSIFKLALTDATPIGLDENKSMPFIGEQNSWVLIMLNLPCLRSQWKAPHSNYTMHHVQIFSWRCQQVLILTWRRHRDVVTRSWGEAVKQS